MTPWGGQVLYESSFTSIPPPPPPPTPPAPRPTPSTPYRGKQTGDRRVAGVSHEASSSAGVLHRDSAGSSILAASKRQQWIKRFPFISSYHPCLQVKLAERYGPDGICLIVRWLIFLVSRRCVQSATSVSPGASRSLFSSCPCITRPAAEPSVSGTSCCSGGRYISKKNQGLLYKDPLTVSLFYSDWSIDVYPPHIQSVKSTQTTPWWR